jgi:hypothetical protein
MSLTDSVVGEGVKVGAALDENDPNWVNDTADAAAAQAGAGLGGLLS